jgi:NAD(P)-dependent dehydrogenase (short-subunit alcohol dehydrogenase family)
VALIVGGASSLGLATARLFLKEGARVVLAAQDSGALKTAESALDDVNVATVVSDPTREADVVATTGAVIDRHGRLDVLVVDTGTPAVPGPVTELDVDEFDRFLAVHVRGTFLACKHGLRVLEDGGSVVIVSGVTGLRAEAGSSAAAAVEHAQVGLMRSLAKESAGRGIRVNTVHPGPSEAVADLRQVPLGRLVRADEIARSVLYLASAQSSFTTGTTLVVDGGLTA